MMGAHEQGQGRRGSQYESRKQKHLERTNLLKEMVANVRASRDAYDALDKLPGFRIAEGDKRRFNRLVDSTRKTAKVASEGRQLNIDILKKDVALSKRAASALEHTFDVYTKASFDRFDRLESRIVELDPGVLESKAGKIADLKVALRNAVADPDAPYDVVVEAYSSLYRFLKSLSHRAEKLFEEREEITSFGAALLEAIDGLEV